MHKAPKKLRYIVWLGVITLFILFGFITWWNAQLGSVSSDKTVKTVVIAKGDNFNEIADQLAEQHLIKSARAFKNYVKKNNLDFKIQTGSFKLSSSMSAKEIARVLTTQPGDDWITLLEGWRDEEMAEKLNKELGISKEEFIKKAQEGYMFPDTYLFPKEATVDYIVRTLRDNFEKKYTDDLRKKVRGFGLTEDQGVILASIVEREARSDGVRRMVAGILLKRLKINMGLNVDAAIQYALGYQSDEKTWWKRHLTYDDLRIDSLYNTYIHAGLPPKPISNPSLSSLSAVANADTTTPYLYYYHDSKGNSYYARTLEEHNANVSNNK